MSLHEKERRDKAVGERGKESTRAGLKTLESYSAGQTKHPDYSTITGAGPLERLKQFLLNLHPLINFVQGERPLVHCGNHYLGYLQPNRCPITAIQAHTERPVGYLQGASQEQLPLIDIVEAFKAPPVHCYTNAFCELCGFNATQAIYPSYTKITLFLRLKLSGPIT